MRQLRQGRYVCGDNREGYGMQEMRAEAQDNGQFVQDPYKYIPLCSKACKAR